jgi:hypothetical protein
MDEDADTGARQAFEALRAEVAALRQAVDEQGVPDYALTLGAIAKELEAVGARLGTMEAHPALRLTPAAHAQQVTAGLHDVQREMSRSTAAAQGRLAEATHALQAIIGEANSQMRQRRREYLAVVLGVVLGFGVWWPLSWGLPWHGGDWLASTLIDSGGRWQAGEALMAEANPQTWQRLVALYQACPLTVATEVCQAALAQANAPLPTPPAVPEGSRPGAPGRAAAAPASLRRHGPG